MFHFTVFRSISVTFVPIQLTQLCNKATDMIISVTITWFLDFMYCLVLKQKTMFQKLYLFSLSHEKVGSTYYSAGSITKS
jgi:hypothetical protein